MSRPIAICVSWRCPRAVVCLMHYCHHTWAALMAAKDAGRTVNLGGTGVGCTDYTEDFVTDAARAGRELPLLGVVG